ncbi:hypothetical protein HMPREF9477_00143 [Lachnospiraceae bacterium 2_1_46FAA]|nr:hypothetical protein HMPREF9477_00143 [Lachnospiraceae bacterium 2_1_46FAA]
MKKELKNEVGIPKYQQIAADIAYKIVDGTYTEGMKVYARSSIGSRYGVSSETARRAMCVLSDWDVVEVAKNSGVVIKSEDNAKNFLQQHTHMQSIQGLKRNILENVEKQQKATKELYGYLDEVIKKIDNYRSINPFIPYELVITDKTPYLNKTVGSINFWQETFATVIAIRRNGTLIMSPGPEAVFRLNDIVYYTGDEDCPDRVRGFMYPNK